VFVSMTFGRLMGRHVKYGVRTETVPACGVT
jgi:hypothetical protein